MKLVKTMDEESESLIRVKLVQAYEDGTTLKREVPCFDGSSAEFLFYTMAEFDDAAEEYEWHDDELFTNYRKTLKNPAKNQWQTIVGEHTAAGGLRDEAGFGMCRTTLIRRYVAETGYDDMVRYLEMCRKPMKMDCRSLASRLQELNLHLPRLPSLTHANPPALTERQLARIYFTMMPVTFQTTFRQSSLARQPETYTLVELTEYMTQLAALEPPSARMRGGGVQDESGGRRSYYRGGGGRGRGNGGRFSDDRRGGRGRGNGGRGHSHGGRGRGGRGYRSRDQRNPDGPRRLDGDKKCPIHLQGYHKWSDCSLNPDSNNYKDPKFQRRGSAQQQQPAGAAYHAHQQYPHQQPAGAAYPTAAVPPGQQYQMMPAPPAPTAPYSYGTAVPPPPPHGY